MMMPGHPSLPRLRAFALGESAGRARRRVAHHLQHCASCRARVHWVRNTVAQARAPHATAPAALDSILARVAAGDRVLLPAGTTRDGAVAPPARTAGRQRRVAGGIAAILAAAALLLAVPQAGAEKSELRITPDAPRAGAPLALEYRPTVRLAGEERLVVRARYRTPGQGSEPRTITLGDLRRQSDHLYRGTVTLPADAVYAVLAVEDTAGRVVDDHAERWEVLVHDEDGRPTFEALRQRMTDALRRNTRLAAEVMQALVELYPGEPAGWYFLYSEESHNAPASAADSLRARYRERFVTLEAAVRASGGPDAEQLWYLIMHASALQDTATRARLRQELIARYPTNGGALQQAGWIAADRLRGDTDAYLAALDSIWSSAPDAAVQPAFDGWMTAQRVGTPELILKWTERMEVARPDWTAGNGVALIEHETTRAAGMRRLRDGIARLDAEPGERPLGRSVAEHDAERARQAGMYYAALGRALLAEGQPAAALDTLDRALRTGWNAPLFRAVGDARLQLADTAGALHAFARLAADPNTTPALADSLRDRLAGYSDPAAWSAHVEAGRAELRAELFARSLNRPPLRPLLRLRDLAGRSHDVRIDGGPLTVVAFWSRFCPPSAGDLAHLDAAARRLGQRGVRFVSITDELDAGPVAAFLDRNGYSLPTYLDPHRDAHNAFDNRGTPLYVALDERGHIRFTSHTAADLLRHIAVLGGPWAAPADP